VELKRKLFKILQSGSTDSADSIGTQELDSLVDVNSEGVPITSSLVERLADEFLTLKNMTSAVELQLYEANEKMAELLEQVRWDDRRSITKYLAIYRKHTIPTH